MQVDDEHLSLTDQKDQVGDPLRVLLRFSVGWGSQMEGRGVLRGWTSGEVEWTELSLSTPPLMAWNGAFRAHFSKLQTLNLALKK